MKNFIINIMAGIALSILTWFLIHVIQPFYFAWRHKAPRLEGQWSFFDTDKLDSVAVGSAKLKQRGEKVYADVARTTSRKGRPLSRGFKYFGKVRDGQVLLSFEEPMSNGFIAGNLVLKVSGDLKTLTGFTVYLDHDSGIVVAYPIIFRKL
jgi:hypothetical protein